MLIYAKVGTLPGMMWEALGAPYQRKKPYNPKFKPRSLRTAPHVGQWFSVREVHEKYAKPIGVILREVRVAHSELIYICERF